MALRLGCDVREERQAEGPSHLLQARSAGEAWGRTQRGKACPHLRSHSHPHPGPNVRPLGQLRPQTRVFTEQGTQELGA